MKNLFLALFFISFTTLSFTQSIDNANSNIEFKIGSILWSKVKGDISNLKGTVIFKENDLSKSSINVSVDVNTISTNNKKRDAHLKTDDFFDAEKFPKISFKSNSISKTADGFVSKGKLTIKDVTKDISIPFTVEKNGSNTTLMGGFEIDRLDYNIGVDQGTMLVDKKVKIDITCVLN